MKSYVDATMHATLQSVLRRSDFEVHFQPLVDINRGAILGYEALTRGPANSPLHSPLVLFEVAAREHKLIELENLVVRRAVTRFRELGLPGQLFLNLTADTLLAAEPRIDSIAQEFAELDMPASRVVIELTETRPVLQPERLQSTMNALRRLGFVVAIDDLGEGFASLKRWLDIRPDFVKIDRHFIDGIAQEPLKQQFVRSILEMASSSGCTVIAEGLEQASDLAVLQRLGVPICQGYLLARPSATPRTSLRADVDAMLRVDTPKTGWPRVMQQSDSIQAASQLARRGHTASIELSCAKVVDMFQRDAHLYSIPVLDDAQRPIGILRSMDVLKRSSERYFMDIHARHSCIEMMDRHPLVFDACTSLRAMSDAIANLDDRLMVDGFIVTQDGAYFGTGRTSDLLKAVSDLQVHFARYANPLTMLPGNVPIDHQLDHLITQGENFVVAAWDIDNFKPFNDVYGYRCGDDIIKLTAQILLQAADSELDFVGHIGGDDFLVMHCTADWEARLQRVCDDFDTQVQSFFTSEHLQAGGYITLNRQNQEIFAPLPTLSAGVVCAQRGTYESARVLAAGLIEPKRVVKSRAGKSRYFVDRRKSAVPLVLAPA